jgi:hypothetical protein
MPCLIRVFDHSHLSHEIGGVDQHLRRVAPSAITCVPAGALAALTTAAVSRQPDVRQWVMSRINIERPGVQLATTRVIVRGERRSASIFSDSHVNPSPSGDLTPIRWAATLAVAGLGAFDELKHANPHVPARRAQRERRARRSSSLAVAGVDDEQPVAPVRGGTRYGPGFFRFGTGAFRRSTR